MSKFDVNDDDVVSMEINQTANLVNAPTFKFRQVINRLYQILSAQANSTIATKWVIEAVECELLRPKSEKGWQKGKIHIRFEFIPDETPADIPEADSLVLGEGNETELGSSTTQQQ